MFRAMARRVFFSFHYERDVQRASVVRNHWVTKANAEDAGYVDKAAWQEIEKGGKEAVKKWINEQLKGTSVTAVLIGPETSNREWVRYELQQSYQRGNGILGVHIHNIPGWDKKTDTSGDALFGPLGKDASGNDVYFASVASTYDWVNDDGYNNFAKWVEAAAKKAGK
jgi:hypothetical protein